MLLRALSDSAREIARMHAPRRADTTITATPGQAGACHRRKCGQQCRRRECAQARAGASGREPPRCPPHSRASLGRAQAIASMQARAQDDARRRRTQGAPDRSPVALHFAQPLGGHCRPFRSATPSLAHTSAPAAGFSPDFVGPGCSCHFLSTLKMATKNPENPGSLGQPLSTRRCSSPSRGAPRGREGGWTGPRAQCAACVPSLLPSRR